MKGDAKALPGDVSTPPADAMTSAIDRGFDFLDRMIGGVEKAVHAVNPPKPGADQAPRIEASSSSSSLLRELRVSGAELQMLQFLADRGGRIPWDWSKCRPDVKDMVAGMINKTIVREQELVTHAAQAQGRLMLAITDQGRQCLAQIARMVKRSLPSG